MYLKKQLSASALIYSVIFFSCGKSQISREDMAKKIIGNSEPALMISVKIKDLLDKGGISSKENIPMFMQMLFPEKVDMLAEPDKSGIDVSGKSYVGISGGKDGMLVWGITGVKDKEIFEKSLKEEGKEKFEEIEGYNTVTEGKEMLIAWDEKNLIFIGNENGKVKAIFTDLAKKIEEDAKKINLNFDKFFASKNDFATLTSVSGAIEMQKNMPGSNNQTTEQKQMINEVTNKMKNCYTLFEVNFEKDKVVADFANLLTDKAKKEFNFLSEKGLPKGLIEAVGSNEILAFLSVNGDVQKYFSSVKKMMSDDMITQITKSTKVDINNLIESLKGNLLVCLTGFEKKEISLGVFEGKEEKYAMTIPNACLVTTIGGDYLQTFADSILKEKKRENYYVIDEGNNSAYLTFNNGILKFSNSEVLIKSEAGSPKLDAQALKALAKPIGFFANLNAIFLQWGDSEKVKTIAKKFKGAFGGMDINGGHAELILNNGGKNSLWTLVNIGVESAAEAMPSL